MAGSEEGRTVHVRVYVRTKRVLDELARKGEPYARVISVVTSIDGPVRRQRGARPGARPTRCAG